MVELFLFKYFYNYKNRTYLEACSSDDLFLVELFLFKYFYDYRNRTYLYVGLKNRFLGKRQSEGGQTYKYAAPCLNLGLAQIYDKIPYDNATNIAKFMFFVKNFSSSDLRENIYLFFFNFTDIEL